MNFDTQILDEEAAKEAKANVSLDIIEAEKRLVDEEAEEEQIVEETNAENESNKVEKTSIAKSAKKTTVKTKDRLHKKALYDSVSFEVELQKIFKEDNPDEIWLMSPWIRKSAFMNDRGPLIENFLADENNAYLLLIPNQLNLK